MKYDPPKKVEGITSQARTPKGRRTLQAILDATFDLVSSEGLAAASQEAIAKPNSTPLIVLEDPA